MPRWNRSRHGSKNVKEHPQRMEQDKCPNPVIEAKYGKAVDLYAGTQIPIREICDRCGVTVNGFNDCSLDQFIRRHFPEAIEKHQKLVQQQVKKAD